MLYFLLYQVMYREYGATSESYFYKGLNVIQYVTFRTAWSTIKANLGPELVGMRPTYAQRTKSSGAVEYRLVLVGAVKDNTEAITFCGKLSTMKLSCRAGHFRVSQLAEP